MLQVLTTVLAIQNQQLTPILRNGEALAANPPRIQRSGSENHHKREVDDDNEAKLDVDD